MKSPFYSAFQQGFNGSFTISKDEAQSVGDMTTIVQAINRYHADNGAYPPNLGALGTKYLPNPAILHNAIDTNTNPNHITYNYMQPANDAPMSTPVLSLSGTFSMPAAKTSETITTTMSLDGAVQRTQIPEPMSNSYNSGNSTSGP